MKEEQRRLLSSLIDGECNEAQRIQAIDDLLADEQLQQTLKRYLLIGQGLRRETIRPTKTIHQDSYHRTDDIYKPMVSNPRPPLSHSRTNGWWTGSPASLGITLAVGLALVALFVLPEKPSMKIVPTAALSKDPTARVSEQRWQQDDPLLRAKLDQLIVDHQERAAGPGFSGIASYVPVIGYEGQP